jgi:hypothetical protein
VKRWRSASMAMRWTAAAMQEAARGFRRLKAHKQLPTLRAALEAHHKTHTASLLAKPTPLNINFGSDFAMFNKQAGHPEGTQSDLYKVLFACVRMNRRKLLQTAPVLGRSEIDQNQRSSRVLVDAPDEDAVREHIVITVAQLARRARGGRALEDQRHLGKTAPKLMLCPPITRVHIAYGPRPDAQGYRTLPGTSQGRPRFRRWQR